MIDDNYLRYLDNEVRRHRDGLEKQARSLGRRLTMLADQLAKGDAIVNDLGEVQAEGPMLDVRCAAYGQALDARKTYIAFEMDAQIGR